MLFDKEKSSIDESEKPKADYYCRPTLIGFGYEPLDVNDNALFAGAFRGYARSVHVWFRVAVTPLPRIGFNSLMNTRPLHAEKRNESLSFPYSNIVDTGLEISHLVKADVCLYQ